MSRKTTAFIDASALVHNFTQLQTLAPHSQHLAVIKADAYGHGAVEVARALKDVCPRFAVAIIEEAIALREAGITSPIVILEGPHESDECVLAAEKGFILVVHDRDHLSWLQALPASQRPAIWLKVDSGMHRLGFDYDDIPALVEQHRELLSDETHLMTHMACADELESDVTSVQLERFLPVAKATQLPVSIANSPAAIFWEKARGNWNRLGVALYGASPFGLNKASLPTLRPVMTLQAAVISVKTIAKGEHVGYGFKWQAEQDSRIAVVGIGYADGYPRHCPNGTPVAVNGCRAELVGRVSMDMITIDVTHLPNVKVGDTVELWGNTISIDEVAACAQTISYELMTRVSVRVPRQIRV